MGTHRKPVVLFTDGGYFSPAFLERFFPRILDIADVRTTRAINGTDLAKEMADVDILMARLAPVTREVFDAAPLLRGIQSWGVGVETIDLAAATELGIPVANSPGNVISVAEATLCLMLAVTKSLVVWADVARRGTVPDGSMRGTELWGKRLGVIGYGRIGRLVASRAQAFGMEVMATDPYAESNGQAQMVSLETLLRTADVISLHCLLTPETEHLINDASISLMKPSAILVNTARGKLVDEHDLIRALQEKHLAGAGLDVFEKEPVDISNPLLAMPNVIATPHTLARTWESGDRTTRMIEEGILALLGGQLPEFTLNRGVGAPRKSLSI